MGYCAVCKERWTSLAWAHCTAEGCHRTFRTVGGFNKHRKNMKCLNPEEIGMIKRGNVWLTPMPDEIASAMSSPNRRTRDLPEKVLRDG